MSAQTFTPERKSCMQTTGERDRELQVPSQGPHASQHTRQRHFALVKLRASPSLEVAWAGRGGDGLGTAW